MNEKVNYILKINALMAELLCILFMRKYYHMKSMIGCVHGEKQFDIVEIFLINTNCEKGKNVV